MIAELLLAQELGCAQRLLRKDAEEAFDLVEPRCARRRVVEVDARVLLEPRDNLGRTVGRRIVEHDVKLAARILARHQLHEGQE